MHILAQVGLIAGAIIGILGFLLIDSLVVFHQRTQSAIQSTGKYLFGFGLGIAIMAVLIYWYSK